VPDGLRPPVATEVHVVMPDQGGPKKVPRLPGARLKVPWLEGLRDGRTVLAVGDSTGASGCVTRQPGRLTGHCSNAPASPWWA
jgi:hypothetical protein